MRPATDLLNNPAGLVDQRIGELYLKLEEVLAMAGQIQQISYYMQEIVNVASIMDDIIVTGPIYDTEALGRAGTEDGADFKVISTDPDIAFYLYTRVSASTSTLKVSVPSISSLVALAPINDPTFTGTVSGISKSMVGLSNVDNTSDMDKPLSTLAQALSDAYDLHVANTSNPHSVTKSQVGLGSADNTSDANKPISTAQAIVNFGIGSKKYFESFTLLIADTSIAVSDVIVVRNGYNGQPEQFLIVAATTYTANASTVVNLVGITGQAVSTRRNFNSYTAWFEDTRPPAFFVADPDASTEDVRFFTPFSDYDMALNTAAVISAANLGGYHVINAGGTKAFVLPGERGYNVKAFGAKGDSDGTAGNGTADDAAFLACVNAIIATGIIVAGWRGNTIPMYIPRSTGFYRIVNSDVLLKPTTSTAFNIEGDGYLVARRNGASVILFDPVLTGQTFWNAGATVGFTHINKVGFKSANGGLYLAMTSSQSIVHTECAWSGFADLFDFSGALLGSEFRLKACKLSGFTGVAFTMGNDQAVNVIIDTTEAEVFTGNLFSFLKGGSVVWNGGSIIPTASVAPIILQPAAAVTATFGGANSPHLTLNYVRFEVRDGASLIRKENANARFEVVFNDCGMGGSNIPTVPSIPNMIYWRGAGRLMFNRCMNMTKYSVDISADLNVTTQQFQLYADTCDLPGDLVTNSTLAYTGTASNTTRLPRFKIKDCDPAIDGEYSVGGGTYNLAQNVIAQPRGRTFSADGGAIMTAVVSPVPSGLIQFPPTIIRAIEIRPIALTGYGTPTSTVTVKTSDGLTTLATITWATAAPANAREIVYLNHRILQAAPNLLFEFTTTYAGGATFFWRGHMFLHY